jgi:nucleotide-binding universal stress UspA family protein
LISTDGSELAGRGVDQGLALAKALGAKVTFVTVTDRLAYAGIDGGAGVLAYGELAAAQNEAAAEILAAAQAKAVSMGVEAETVYVEDAPAAEAIIDIAKTRDCSLIAMSSHGRRGISRLVLGSVAAEVLAGSPVPVLVVR